ncbi:hypothetical protein [Pseudomonas phage PseuP_224]|nr:hypothetical protein [Pseudomonas phage PseuP_224]
MSNEMISVPREMAERALKSIDDATAVFNDDNRGPGYWICYACDAETNAQWRDGVRIGSHEDIAHEKDCWAEHLRTLLAKPAEQHQSEPILIQAVAVTRQSDDGMYLEWLLEGGISEMESPGQVLFAMPEANDLCDEDGSAEIYTRPAEQPEPISSESDQYKAELYDEVWQLARDMGYGNVTDALMQLKKQPAPVAVVLPERLQQVLKFLEGAENLDGHWFGEPGPTGQIHWWRAELRKALEETNLFANQQ